MLLELAIGDAYGAGFEYSPDRMVREQNNLSAYVQHPRHKIKPGCYTDDTQMSIAIAEAIVGDDPWTAEALAERFVVAFKRDPREGYASRFYDFLQEIQTSAEFLAKIRPDSDKSGAAMRACPIGVFDSIPEVIRRATIQAAITHNTPGGINAAIAASLMTHFFIYRLGTIAQLPAFIASHVAGPWMSAWRGKVGSPGVESVHGAITAVAVNRSLSELLKACIAFTGDVDTVATIALAAASCSVEYRQDLPEHLFTNLENGPYGGEFLSDLDQRLKSRAVTATEKRNP